MKKFPLALVNLALLLTLPSLSNAGGFTYDSSMVSGANRSLVMPVGASYKFGMGANWLMSPKIKLGFSYELAYLGKMSISQNRSQLAGQVVGDFHDTMMHFFTFTLNWGSEGVTFGPGGGQTPL